MAKTKSTKGTSKSETRKSSSDGKTANGKNFAGLSLEERKEKARVIVDKESNNEELLGAYKKLYKELDKKFEHHSEAYIEKKFEQEFNKAKESLGIDDKQANAVKEQVYWKNKDSSYKYQKPESFKGDLPNAKTIFININPAIANEYKNPDVPNDKTSDVDTYNYCRDAFKKYDNEGKVPNAYQGAIKITDAIAKGEGRSGIMDGKKNRAGNTYQAEDVRALSEQNVAIIDVSPIRSDNPKNVKEYLKDGTESIIEKLKASNAETVVLTGAAAKKYKDIIEEATDGKVKVLVAKKHISYINPKTCDDITKEIQNDRSNDSDDDDNGNDWSSDSDDDDGENDWSNDSDDDEEESDWSNDSDDDDDGSDWSSDSDDDEDENDWSNDSDDDDNAENDWANDSDDDEEESDWSNDSDDDDAESDGSNDSDDDEEESDWSNDSDDDDDGSDWSSDSDDNEDENDWSNDSDDDDGENDWANDSDDDDGDDWSNDSDWTDDSDDDNRFYNSGDDDW